MPDFAAEGIDPQHPFAKKLWLASAIQGHRNPWAKPLTEYSVAQLDFVLEMASIDEPEKWQFNRPLKPAQPAAPSAMAAWHNVMAGKLSVAWMARTGIADATARIQAWRARRGELRPGLTRAGQPIKEVG
jgi:hypothetical protein